LTRYFNGSVVVDSNNVQAANNTPGVKYLDVVKYVVTENGVDSIYYYKCKVSVDYGNTSTFPNGKTGHSPELDTSY
jgi:TRAP-type mannitol/chloroaromatic compound transport system substrate-binding protein